MIGQKTSERRKVSVPLGAIVPIMSNLAGSHTIPASGTVDLEGFQRCDGAAIPADQVLSGSTPDLSNDRFLMGSTSSGDAGGTNDKSLIEDNIPNHTHDMQDHTHTGVTGIEPGHEHTTSSSAASGIIGTTSGGSDASMSYVDSTSTPDTGWQHDHGHTFTTNSISSNATSATGTGASFDNRPNYVTVQYLIRVY